ncbi:MAG: hypothetical protein JJLCMIEE_03149 [Acidimicrobiales bacterium]|nr:hypothetical protein [Acidimicrobiales bacterium]
MVWEMALGRPCVSGRRCGSRHVSPVGRVGIVVLVAVAASCSLGGGDEVSSGQQPSEEAGAPVVDLSSTEWRPVPLPESVRGLEGVSSVALGSELLLAGGGKRIGEEVPEVGVVSWQPSSAVNVFDTESGKWSELPDLPGQGAVSGVTGTRLGSSTILVGLDCEAAEPSESFSCSGSSLTTTIWTLSEGAGEWEPHLPPPEVAKRFDKGLSSLSSVRSIATLTGVVDGQLVVALHEGSYVVGSAGYWELYLVDSASWEWKQIATPPSLYEEHQLCVTSGALRTVSASIAPAGEFTDIYLAKNATLLTFEPATGEWRPGPVVEFEQQVSASGSRVVCAEEGMYAQEHLLGESQPGVDTDSWWHLSLPEGGWERLPPIVELEGAESDPLVSTDWTPAPAGTGLLAMANTGLSEVISVAEYDPVSNAWTELPDIPSGGRGGQPIVVGSTAIDVAALTFAGDTDLPAIRID